MRNEVVHWTELFDLVAPERRPSLLRMTRLSCTSPVFAQKLPAALQTLKIPTAVSESESMLDCASSSFDVSSPASYC